jgi:cation diffusion facilitator family transporter
MLVTMLVNWLVTRYEHRRGDELRSPILLADAAHTRSDIFVSLSVLAGLIAVKLGWPWIDAAVALVIVVVIGHTGWQIIRSASRVLSDTAVVDPATVAKIARSVEGVKSTHKIRSRGTDQAIYLDLHIQVDGSMAVEEAHRLGHLVQARLIEELGITDVVVHVEPVKFKWSDAFSE